MYLRIFIIGLLPLLAGCGSKEAKKPSGEKPAKVESHPSEKDIYRIILTPKAFQRLQISTTPVGVRSVPRFRSLGGDVVVPDGRRIPVTAPLTGKLLPAGSSPALSAGSSVATNDELFRLAPMLPPERQVFNDPEQVQMASARMSLATSQIQAAGDVKQAEAEVEAAKILHARAKRLLADGAGLRSAVDDAQAGLNIANKKLEAARDRKKLLDALSLDAEIRDVGVIPIRAPQGGTVQTVTARLGQVVNAGAVLFEIVDLDRLWVRVPVYAGMAGDVDDTKEVGVGGLAEAGEMHSAAPVQAPPTANPAAASIDLYYELDNTTGRFRPGERVSVHVQLKGETESRVVPHAAILRDIHGTPWVYVQTGETEFRRVRTAVKFTTADLAVLSLGPEVGANVVVDGAAELFGTEFGAGK